MENDYLPLFGTSKEVGNQIGGNEVEVGNQIGGNEVEVDDLRVSDLETSIPTAAKPKRRRIRLNAENLEKNTLSFNSSDSTVGGSTLIDSIKKAKRIQFKGLDKYLDLNLPKIEFTETEISNSIISPIKFKTEVHHPKIKDQKKYTSGYQIPIDETISKIIQTYTKSFADLNMKMTRNNNQKKSLKTAFAESNDKRNLSKVILKNPEMYTIPKISELNESSKDGHCYVHDFIVGHKEHGTLTFLGLTDIYGLNLDELVKFEKTKIIYPFSSGYKTKSNKPIKISLFNMWPNNPAFNLESPDNTILTEYRTHLIKESEKFNSTFIDYENGTWTFEVIPIPDTDAVMN